MGWFKRFKRKLRRVNRRVLRPLVPIFGNAVRARFGLPPANRPPRRRRPLPAPGNPIEPNPVFRTGRVQPLPPPNFPRPPGMTSTALLVAGGVAAVALVVFAGRRSG